MMHGWTCAAAGAALIGLGVAGALGVNGLMQAGPSPGAQPAGGQVSPPATPPGRPAGPQGGGVSPEMVMKLMAGLKATPGCLGTDLAMCQSGKRVIFAWFKDKAAAMAWYNAKEHQGAVDAVAPDRDKTRTPMADVPDEGPILAVAAVSPGSGALAIELYAPLKGGLRMPGGGFAPSAFVDLVGPAKEGYGGSEKK